ncbi:hypothetical protein WIMU106979_24600 [Williamsia muralis]
MTATAITVYTKPACVQCNAIYRALDKAGVAYEVVDITADNDAQRLRNESGPPASARCCCWRTELVRFSP